MYIDDIEVFSKNEKEMETLIQTRRIYRRDRGMKFDTDKCAILIMKSGKKESAEGIEQLDRECIKTLGEKKNYKYSVTLVADTIKQAEMKEKIRKEYLRRTRKLLKTKLCNRNLIKEIKTWVVRAVRYLRPFLELRNSSKCTKGQES